jgi:hypothetical protein
MEVEFVAAMRADGPLEDTDGGAVVADDIAAESAPEKASVLIQEEHLKLKV